MVVSMECTHNDIKPSSGPYIPRLICSPGPEMGLVVVVMCVCVCVCVYVCVFIIFIWVSFRENEKWLYI